MGEKPLSTDESAAAAAQQSGGGSAGSAGSTTPQAGGAGIDGEPIPDLDVKLGKNPGGG